MGERLKREEEERLAAAAALKEIQERLERQKAAAEARRLAAKEGDVEESIELIEFRRAQKGKEAHQATWLAFVLASLALYWALRVFQEHIEREHRDELDVELQIAPYCYFEIKKWP